MPHRRLSESETTQITKKLPQLLFLDVSSEYVFAVTQPLTVKHPYTGEIRHLGHLSIKIDLSSGTHTTRFDIRGLVVGKGDNSFPSIPHTDYIDEKRTFCWGNYTFLENVDVFAGDTQKLTSHLRCLLVFCTSVAANEQEVVERLEKYPLSYSSKVKIVRDSKKSTDSNFIHFKFEPGLGFIQLKAPYRDKTKKFLYFFLAVLTSLILSKAFYACNQRNNYTPEESKEKAAHEPRFYL
jgi:hypothetical protein